jgi:hypothetical protein
MDSNLLIVLAVLAVLVVAGILLYGRQRSEHLRSRFGPEYEHQVEEKGSRLKAEADLAQREKRVAKLSIRPLAPADQDPPRAVDYADALLGEVMSARGYPVSDFEERAGDISVDHPTVVNHYRAGHDIAVRHRRGEAGTEDLRQAMIHYRALFEELVTERQMADTASH